MLKLTFTANLFPPPVGLGRLVFFAYLATPLSHFYSKHGLYFQHQKITFKRHGAKDFINPDYDANSPSYLRLPRIVESTTQLASCLLSGDNANGESS